MAVALSFGIPSPEAGAAQRVVPRIDAFGPYRLGMTLPEAQAAHKGAKRQDCGELAPDRQCLALEAAVFEEPAVIYAVLDEAGARVDRIVAQLDPQLTRRRAYRCVRLSEKVFALLVVVYGSKYKQSYDQNRRPLPAVAWDGAEAGRLIFETRCKTPDEGNPRISVVEHYPEGVKPPPPVARNERDVPQDPSGRRPPDQALDATAPPSDVPLSVEGQETVPQAPAATPPNIALAGPAGEPPPPLSAPVGAVEELPPGTPDTGGALDAAAMAALTRELAHSKGKAPPGAEALPPPAIPDEGAGAAPSPLAPAPAASGGSGEERPAEGSHEVPVDVAPAPAASAESRPAIGLAPPEPLAAAVDPGPVTFNEPSTPAVAAEDPDTPPPSSAPPAVDLSATGGAAPPTGAEASAAAREAVAEAVPQATAEPVTRPVPEAVAVEVARANPAKAAQEQTPQEGTPVAARAQPAQAPSPATNKPAFDRTAPAQMALLPPAVRAPSYDAPGTPPVPTDLEAPEPFTVPEDEHVFRDAATVDLPNEAPAAGSTQQPAAAAEPASEATLESEVKRRLASAESPSAVERSATAQRSTEGDPAAAAPMSLLSVSRDDSRGQAPSASGAPPRTATARPTPADAETPAAAAQTSALSAPEKPAPVASAPPARSAGEAPGAEAEPREPSATPEGVPAPGWSMAAEGRFTPVLSGGWRYRAPVPPAKPWRERGDAPESATSGG